MVVLEAKYLLGFTAQAKHNLIYKFLLVILMLEHPTDLRTFYGFVSTIYMDFIQPLMQAAWFRCRY